MQLLTSGPNDQRGQRFLMDFIQGSSLFCFNPRLSLTWTVYSNLVYVLFCPSIHLVIGTLSSLLWDPGNAATPNKHTIIKGFKQTSGLAKLIWKMLKQVSVAKQELSLRNERGGMMLLRLSNLSQNTVI